MGYKRLERSVRHVTTYSWASEVAKSYNLSFSPNDRALQQFARACVLNYEKETCKGGSRRRYTPRLSEREFKKHIAEMIVTSLIRDFPRETEETLKELQLNP